MTDLRILASAMLLGVTALAAAAPANAAACRDTHGKFISCPGVIAAAPRRTVTRVAVTHAPVQRRIVVPVAKRTTVAVRAVPPRAVTAHAVTAYAVPVRTVVVAKPAAGKPARPVVAVKRAVLRPHTVTRVHAAG